MSLIDYNNPTQLNPNYKPDESLSYDFTPMQMTKIAIGILIGMMIFGFLSRMNTKMDYELQKQDEIIKILKEKK